MKKIILFKFLLFVVTLVTLSESNAQYTNNWLSGKYNQTFVKIGVVTSGLQKITFAQLAANGLNVNDSNKEFLNVYHRGNLVKIIRINSADFEFYGEKNDGSRDSLMFRPTTSRMNHYYSLYSDIGAYFVTVGNSTEKASIIQQSALNGSSEPYHLQKDVFLLNTSSVDYSHGPWALYYPFPNESYLKDGETMSGPMILGQTKQTKNFTLSNLITGNGAPLPKLDLMVNGRQAGTQRIKVTLGAATTPIYTFNFSGFAGSLANITIPESEITNNAGSFSVQGDVGTSDEYRFSLSYYTLSYPQRLDMTGKTSATLSFPVTTNSQSRVRIENVPGNPTILDISDINNPKLVNATLNGDNSIEIMIPRESGKSLKLFVTNNSPTNNRFSPSPLVQFVPENHDYIVITNKNLLTTATSYASYRQTLAGGSYKPLVVDIADIYNQFNYGEPSPLAIKQFVDYMLSKGISDKHHLFLIGKTVSATRYLTKELPDYIPTMGYPGSDILLTAGLHGTNKDIPTIPVGRLATTAATDVTNYLNKVKLYESKANQELWRKQVIHINGGHSASQIQQFDNIMKGLESYVEDQATFKGKDVIPYVKQGYTLPSETVPANISADLNQGIGMITYFGHGSPNDTDYDIKRFGAEPTYNNTGKFPFMYFNGCGVSNIFANYGNATTNARADALANTWVLADGKGAIANIGGTLLSYVQPTEKYLKIFYEEIFSTTDPTGPALRATAGTRQSIGKIMKTVAEKTISPAPPALLDVTNIHQSLLLGDPAIVILPVDQGALPVNLTSFSGQNISSDEILLTWTTIGESNNRNFIVEKSKDALTFEELGSVDGKGTITTQHLYSIIDTKPFTNRTYYRLKQVDLDGTITTSKIIDVLNRFGDNVVFPNPAEDHVNIKTPTSTSVTGWKLFNIEGKLLKLSDSSESRISLKGLPSGKYLVEITSSDTVVTRTVILKK